MEELRYLIKGADKEGEIRFKKMLAELDITPSQNEVLKILSKKDGLTLNQLGELLICGSKSPSRVIQRLVIKDMVEKKASQKDARRIILSITEKGEEILRESLQIENAFNESIKIRLEGRIDLECLVEVLSEQIRDTESSRKIQNRKNIEPF